jgi:branched-chain amino acid aminotransferase
MHVCLNGKFVKADQAKISIFDNGFLYGDGVYDTLRTYNGKVWELNEHLERLEKSAKVICLKIPYSKQKLAELVVKLIKKNGFKESRVRISLTRGQNGFDFLNAKKPTLLIVAEQLIPQPESVYKNGVTVVTVRAERFLPGVKSISLLPMVFAQQKAKKAKAYEGIFVDSKGFVREGSITNIFVVKNGVLFVPKTHILAGTTRKTVLKLARSLHFKIRITDFTRRKLYIADEIFVTNAPRGIIPVKKVDKYKVGSGRPGKITKQLMKSFNEYVYELQKNRGQNRAERA